ncbi:MAG: hypothetical protein F9K44_04880 [Hyphomicrobiaceae bacterium]|nr:MAG: hypothetical protein F9K44_04880 [Hyphomicrobiaceae bacterium]
MIEIARVCRVGDFVREGSDVSKRQKQSDEHGGRDAAGADHTDKRASSEGEGGDAGLEDYVQAHLGRHLRMMYSNLVNEPVPKKFERLLEELKAQEKDRPGGKD